MRIGILTYHRSHNYGALLQAVALRYQLVQMGHEVYFIDYWPEYHRQMYAMFSMAFALRYGKRWFMKYMWNFVRYYNSRKKRIMSFQMFIDKYISPHCAPYSPKEYFDRVVYGSDQIWRKQDGLSYRFNPVYFADNILEADKHISYAASMGIMKLSDDDILFLKDKLKKMSLISVRENSLHDALKEIGFETQIVLDPTLLLSGLDWNKMLKISRLNKENYVLYYRLQIDSFEEKYIADFARERKCEVVLLDGLVRDTKKNVFSTAGPMEFLSLIKYAEFVFTSSYHGLIFSLIFSRQFYASFNQNSERAKSILNHLNLADRLLLPHSRIPSNPVKIDYEETGQKIDMLRKSSIVFLEQI